MIKTQVFTVLFMLVLLSSCTKSDRSGLIDATSLEYDTSKIAIIPWDSASRYPFNQVDYDTAILIREDIEVVDSLLVSTVMNYNSSLADKYHFFKIDLDGKSYRKQLIVVKNPKGEKVVWVNCLCGAQDKSWKTRALMVEDGGPCYFNFKINLRTNTVYDFTVNGLG